ncbi:MAG: Cys-tRNA(Pro) deacylase [Moraxella sp.]|nr:Cys-tRNA(Pro) deacylase [Moraxella sp.]
MTPAIRLLKQQKIPHSVHEYQHDPAAQSFGLEAADKLGLSVDETFKTLLVSDGVSWFVCCLPVHHKLNLKKVASKLGVKKIQMAQVIDAERLTGYLVGGISPLGQKKRLKTLIHTSAKTLDKIYVSGGRRGLDIGLSPNDLTRLLSAEFADVVD